MIIKLIQPKMAMRPMDTTLKTRMAPSLGLLTIANMFCDKHTVILENENIEEINYDEKADIVGITVTVDVADRAADIADKFRKQGIPVVAGGIHITAYSESLLEKFDALSVGIAELTWHDIVADLEKGKLKKVYTCNKKIKSTDIVSPAYHLVDKSKYLYCNVISTSRGCPFCCDFCYNSCDGYKGLYINRRIEDVIADIKKIGLKHIMFIDDNFIGNPKWTMDFVRAIRPLKIKWNAAVSANIADMPKLLDEMKLSGCQSLFIGFESLNTESISNVNKKQNSIRKYEKLVDELHKRGIMINASFVFGLDGDDNTTFSETLNWIVKNKIETVTSHILTPYPGTALYDRMYQSGQITDFNLSHYNTANVVFKPKNMTAEELYNGYIKIYRDIYSLKNIIKRIPKAKHQIVPYLLFNIFYRKYGRFTQWLCSVISYGRLGKLAEKISGLL